MTDAARYSAPHETPDAAKAELLLPIPSDGIPATVFVKVLSAQPGTTPVIGFSLPAGTGYFTGGMTWPQCTENYGQFLNFVFEPGAATIDEIEPDPASTGFWVSRPASPLAPPPSQQGCVQNVVGTYNFHVMVRTSTDKYRVDPKIVVTPQNI